MEFECFICGRKGDCVDIRRCEGCGKHVCERCGHNVDGIYCPKCYKKLKEEYEED